MIIDRFDGEFAVCELEDGSFSDIPIKAITGNPKEGDVLCSLPQGGYAVDAEQTELRRQKLLARRLKLLKGKE